MPTDHDSHHFLAPLLLEIGDVNGYRVHRERMLQRFSGTNDPRIAERTVKDSLLIPANPAELETIARMSETALAAGSTHKLWPYFTFAKALLEYRRGNFAEATNWLEKTLAMRGDVYRKLEATAVLAMAQHQLKQTEEARAALEAATAMAEGELPRLPGKKDLGDRWNDWIIAHLLLREAAALSGTSAGAVANH